MQTAEVDPNDFTPEGQQKGDEQLLVKFFIKARQDSAASKLQGRAVFKDVEYIDIKIPGNRTGGACRPASYMDKMRFPRHYDAFKLRAEAPIEGTPLTEWPQITRSQAEELGFYNIKTVEQLVGLSDTHAKNFMGINALKLKAKAWLENASITADATAIAERDEKIATLQAQVAELLAIQKATLDSKSEPKPTPKKRTRRKTTVTDDGPLQNNK